MKTTDKTTGSFELVERSRLPFVEEKASPALKRFHFPTMGDRSHSAEPQAEGERLLAQPQSGEPCPVLLSVPT